MKSLIAIVFMLLFVPLAFGGPPPEQKDEGKCKDHPLFTRMPGYWIHSCDEKEFDAHDFVTGKGTTTRVEGHLWRLSYYPQNSLTTKPSRAADSTESAECGAEARRNPGRVATEGRTPIGSTGTARKCGSRWGPSSPASMVTTSSKKGRWSRTSWRTRGALSNDIRNNGHAAVYGILFDTGKWDIKPESAQAIGEVAKLLKSDPNLKVYVVGHTDNVGGVEPNLKLSENRAEAVKQALIRNHGVAAARLRAFGAAQFAPVASNDAEDGRSRNRRVELVKQ